MVFQLLDRFENLITNRLVSNYPEWELSKYLISMGNKVRHTEILEDSLLAEPESLIRNVKMTAMLAHNKAHSQWISKVESHALIYYEEVYFLTLADARAFFSVVFYLRFFVETAKNFIRLSIWNPKPSGNLLSDAELDYLDMITSQPQR